MTPRIAVPDARGQVDGLQRVLAAAPGDRPEAATPSRTDSIAIASDAGATHDR